MNQQTFYSEETRRIDNHFVDPVSRLILMIISAALIFWSLALLFFPIDWMGWIFMSHYGKTRPDLWHDSALLAYMVRSSGTLYGWLGVIFYICSKDPGRFAPVFRTSGVMLVFMSLTLVVSGLIYGLPPGIYVSDAVLAALGAYAIYRLRPKIPDL